MRGKGPRVPRKGSARLCRHGGERSRWGLCRCVWMGPWVMGVGLASVWAGVAGSGHRPLFLVRLCHPLPPRRGLGGSPAPSGCVSKPPSCVRMSSPLLHTRVARVPPGVSLTACSFVTSGTDVFRDSGWAWTQSLGSAAQISGGSVGARPPAQPPHPLAPSSPPAAVGQERQASPACECPGTVVCLPAGSPTLEGDMRREATLSCFPTTAGGPPFEPQFPQL